MVSMALASHTSHQRDPRCLRAHKHIFNHQDQKANMQANGELRKSPAGGHAAPGPGSAAAAAAATGVAPAKKRLDPSVVQHDVFNLAAIMTLISLNLHFVWRESGFMLLWWTTMLYFIVDIAWVFLVPSSVKGGGALVLHHVVTTMLLFVPIVYPEYRVLMGVNMVVEVNTWLLIAKRHYKSIVLEALFYVTWVVMRLILYPYLVWVYTGYYLERIDELGIFCVLLLAPTVQFILTSMNFWWTATMLRQLADKRRLRPKSVEPKSD